jgi:hypothetical protein
MTPLARTRARAAQIIADARAHGAASASAWLSSDNLGGALIMLTWAAVIFLAAGAVGAWAGRTVRAVIQDRAHRAER